MEELYTVSLAKVIDQFHLETIYLPTLPENILIDCAYSNLLLDKIVKLYDVRHHHSQNQNNALAISFINYLIRK